ncbi:hypothetical protein VPHD51_0096 [Vibrio phage D51]
MKPFLPFSRLFLRADTPENVRIHFCDGGSGHFSSLRPSRSVLLR